MYCRYYYFVSPLLNYSNFFFFLYSINFVFIRRPHQDCNKKNKVRHMYIYYITVIKFQNSINTTIKEFYILQDRPLWKKIVVLKKKMKKNRLKLQRGILKKILLVHIVSVTRWLKKGEEGGGGLFDHPKLKWRRKMGGGGRGCVDHPKIKMATNKFFLSVDHQNYKLYIQKHIFLKNCCN